MNSKPNKGIWFYRIEREHTEGQGRERPLPPRPARKANVIHATKLENKDTEMALKTGD